MQPLADGSDTGGSLRNPANFCNVVGLRPSPGRVPVWPSQAGWYTIGVQGPMARTVRDAALMLSAIAGPDRRSPISIAEPGSRFAAPLGRDFKGSRIAWSPTLGGLPVDPRVTRVLEGQRQVFESLGCRVEEGTPDLKEADAVFRAWRAWRFELTLSSLNPEQQSLLKDTLKQEIEAAQKLSGIDLSRAELQRTQLYHRVREFMETYEFLVCPVNQVPPFDLKQPYVKEINGVRMKSYIDWMQSCWTISVLGLPAISVPAGFTPEGLPVGIQIVGRHQDDLGSAATGPRLRASHRLLEAPAAVVLRQRRLNNPRPAASEKKRYSQGSSKAAAPTPPPRPALKPDPPRLSRSPALPSR